MSNRSKIFSLAQDSVIKSLRDDKISSAEIAEILNAGGGVFTAAQVTNRAYHMREYELASARDTPLKTGAWSTEELARLKEICGELESEEVERRTGPSPADMASFWAQAAQRLGTRTQTQCANKFETLKSVGRTKTEWSKADEVQLLEAIKIEDERTAELPPNMLVHPDHGPVTIGIPYDVYAYDKDTGDVEHYPNYTLYFRDGDIGCDIVNDNRPNAGPLKRFHRCFSLSHFKDPRHFSIHNIMLTTAFPHINPTEYVLEHAKPTDKCKKPTVDHIDENHHNNRITNLRWLSWSENSRLGQIKTCGIKKAKREHGIVSGGKLVVVLPKGSPEEEAVTFESRTNAAEYIIEQIRMGNVKTKATQGVSVDLVVPRLGNVCSGKQKSAYGFTAWDVPHEVIEDEVWTESYISPEYQVSSRGRVKGQLNSILTRENVRNGTKYSRYRFHNNGEQIRVYTHILVYYSFHKDESPTKGMDVCHDDHAPLVDGFHRNWLEDLSTGTRTENMVQWHAANPKLK